MADFEVIRKAIVEVKKHPNADALDVLQLDDGTQVIAGLGTYAPNEEVVCFPEHSVIPDGWLKRLGLWNEERGQGVLSGSGYNRVKPINLRGLPSEAVIAKLDLLPPDAPEGDLAAFIGVTRYVPDIPVNLDGEVLDALGAVHAFDINSHPRARKEGVAPADGELVVITEKLHGTQCCIGHDKQHGFYVTSKGLSEKHLALDHANPQTRERNMYVQVYTKHLAQLERAVADGYENLAIYGEIIGPKASTFTYNLAERKFFVFEVKVDGEFLGEQALWEFVLKYEFERVPTSEPTNFLLTDMNDLMQSWKPLCEGQFEGLVVRSVNGSHRAKFISDAYRSHKASQHFKDSR